jgi:hypothetical protein
VLGRTVEARRARGTRHIEVFKSWADTIRQDTEAEVFKSWADTIRQDTEAFKALLESPRPPMPTPGGSPGPRCATWSAGWT